MRKIQIKLEFKLGVEGHTYNPSIPQAVERWGGVEASLVTWQEGVESKKAVRNCISFLNYRKGNLKMQLKLSTDKGSKEAEWLQTERTEAQHIYERKAILAEVNEIT